MLWACAKGSFELLEIVSYLGIIVYYLTLFFGWEEYSLLAVIAGLVLIMFVYVFTYPKYKAEQVMASFFSIVYVGVMLSFVYQTRMFENNGALAGMADILVLLGMRYLCILCRGADWKT